MAEHFHVEQGSQHMKEDLSCSTCELECDCTLYLDRLENKNKPTSCESLRIEYLTNGIMKTIGLDTRISSLTQACLWKSSFTPLQMEFFFFVEIWKERRSNPYDCYNYQFYISGEIQHTVHVLAIMVN